MDTDQSDLDRRHAANEPAAGDPGANPYTAAWWDARYLSGDIRWDTGIVPPEVEALVAAEPLTPGWALDRVAAVGQAVGTWRSADFGWWA